MCVYIYIYIYIYILSKQLTINVILSQNGSQTNLKTTTLNICQHYTSHTIFKIYLNFQIHLEGTSRVRKIKS